MMRIVGGALFHNGKLLIAKRTDERKFWPGLWEILGGRVEKGESDEEALKREFYEESKIKVKVLKQYHEFRYIYIDDDAVENDFIVSADNFHVVIDPKEHTEFRWISENELDDFEMSPDMRESVQKAFKVKAK
jgi:8-oxo-dGTP diphosphatase